MSEFAVEDVFPPVAIGETPRAMPAGIHFAPFVVALIETIEYRMEGAFPVYKQRVAAPHSELGQVQKLVEVYLRRHFSTLAEHSVKVRQLLLSNMNIGLYEGMKALAVQGGELYRKHTYAAPAPVTGNSMVTPTLRKLGALAEEGYESSLAEHSAHLKPNAVGASGGARTAVQQQQQAVASAAVAAATPTAAGVTAADAIGSGRRGRSKRGRTPCAFAGTTCPLAGAAGEEGMAATTDSTGSAVRQGRPRGGQGRERRGHQEHSPNSLHDDANGVAGGKKNLPAAGLELSADPARSTPLHRSC
eukprot:jgi/Undpi1/3174/HiC_scaffold_15.g06548.m1